MTNLAYKSIKTNGDYVDLAQALGITFEEGKVYQIQLMNTATVIISDQKPKEGGFFIFDNKPFGYKHLGSRLWIKSTEKRPVEVNVAEG